MTFHRAMLCLFCGVAAACDTPEPTEGRPLPSGDGYVMVYSTAPLLSGIGIDLRPDVSATFLSDGALSSYRASNDERLELGGASATVGYSDAVATTGSWSGGPTSGRFYNAKPNGDFTFTPNQDGFHYAVARPAASLPSGTVSYVLVGASQPTKSDGSAPGTLDTGTVSIDFAANKVGVELRATLDGSPFTLTTTGGSATPASSECSLNPDRKFFFANTPAYGIRGFVGDDGHIILSYTLFFGTQTLNGAAVLQTP